MAGGSSALAALLCALLPAGMAQAAVANYLCAGDRPLSASMTPRDASIDFDGRHWTLRRVRDSGEARYVNAAQGLTLTFRRSQAEWRRKDQPPLLCKLQQPALQTEALQAQRAASARID
jgi:hypothetical protein